MPKNVGIGLGALAVLALLLFVFMGSNSAAPVAETESQTAAARAGLDAAAEGASPASATEGLFEGSFAELMQKGGNVECSFDQSAEGMTSSGVVYMADGKVRLNYSATLEEGQEPARGAMIQKDNTLYMWSDAMPQGIKMAMAEGQAVSAAPMSNEMFDTAMKSKYDCKAWTPNTAWFEVPPTIEFMSL